MAGTTIFQVETAGEEGKRYVEAVSSADAFQHVAGDYFTVSAVKAAGLRQLVVDGVKVEVSAKAAATKAPAAAPAAGAEPSSSEPQS